MSAVLTRRRPSRARDHESSWERQESLFAGLGTAPAPPAPRVRPEPPAPASTESPAPVPEPAGAPERPVASRSVPTTTGPTLDEAMTALWGELLRGDATTCPVCASAMQPRHSAGAGVVGGRCGACETTLA